MNGDLDETAGFLHNELHGHIQSEVTFSSWEENMPVCTGLKNVEGMVDISGRESAKYVESFDLFSGDYFMQ